MESKFIESQKGQRLESRCNRNMTHSYSDNYNINPKSPKKRKVGNL